MLNNYNNLTDSKILLVYWLTHTAKRLFANYCPVGLLKI